ncbi:MAG: Ger(x)C family spore germination protein [Bacillota bacterium]
MKPLRFVLIAQLSLLAVATAGCWDRVEVNDLGIVTGMALDKAGPRSLKLTVALAIPSRIRPPGSPGGGGPQLPPTTTRAAQGRTVMEAIDLMQEKIERRLFWAHNAVILIGEDLAYEGVTQIVDFFSRHRQPRLRAVVSVVQGKAADVLATMPAIDLVTPRAIREIEALRTGVITNVRDLANMLSSEGVEPITARVQVVRSGATEPGMLGLSEGSGGGANPLVRSDPPQPAITGAAVFKGDRLVGYLDNADARGVLWVRSQLRRAVTTVTLGRPGRYVSFELVRVSSQLRPRFEGERIIMEVKVSSEQDLNENAAVVDTGDPEVLKLLEEELSESIAQRIRLSALKVQKELRADVLGFGEAVRRADPRRWKQLKARWDEIFPEVELDVDVRAAIRRTGLAARPVGMKDQELLKADDLRRMLKGR